MVEILILIFLCFINRPNKKNKRRKECTFFFEQVSSSDGEDRKNLFCRVCVSLLGFVGKLMKNISFFSSSLLSVRYLSHSPIFAYKVDEMELSLHSVFVISGEDASSGVSSSHRCLLLRCSSRH